MATVVETALRNQLLQRRQKLQAFARDEKVSYLQDLLKEVDAALSRMDDGTLGVCDVCHDHVEEDRLLSDPLCRICLDHLPPNERRSLERDLELAARIQSTLLPQPDLAFDGWEVHAAYESAGPVSGDYWDVIRGVAPGTGAVFVFGDISGKGVSASILMASLHAIFRSLIAVGLPLREVLERGNRLFCESTMASSFATLVCGRVAPSGTVEVVNAGHCPPVLLRGGGVETLAATGLPVGLFCTAEYASHTIAFAPGDVLLLYTDGLSEARNRQGEEFGAERIAAVLGGSNGRSGPALTRALLDDVAAFQAGTPRNDDLTIMALRRAVA